MPEQNPVPDFWDVECPEHLKEFKYPLAHVLIHNPSAKREILLQFTQPMPKSKPLVVGRFALSIPHALELMSNIQIQIDKIKGDVDPPSQKRF